MAQGVRRQLFRDAGLARIALDDVPEGGGFGRPEGAESYTIAAERPLRSIRSLGSEQPVADMVRTLNPAVLDRINDVRKGLERASADLDALLESIAPTNAEVKRQVRLHLRAAGEEIQLALDALEAGEEIQLALDALEAAESSASGTIEPNDQA